MPKIVDYVPLPLDDLVLGKFQARTNVSMDYVEELASSIEKLGLLQPIVVCEANETGKWEILTGQHRFLAHKRLKRDTISAAVMDQRVPEAEAKAISITENLVRRKLSGKELVDAITHLYNHYGTQSAVVEATGLSIREVRTHLKYPRLKQELRQLVDDYTVKLQVALKAQDAATRDDGEVNIDDALKFARAMATMSGPQQKKLAEQRARQPKRDADELIEQSKSADKVVQVIATVTSDVHRALGRVSVEEGLNQDEAAALLLEEALTERGLLEAL